MEALLDDVVPLRRSENVNLKICPKKKKAALSGHMPCRVRRLPNGMHFQIVQPYDARTRGRQR